MAIVSAVGGEEHDGHAAASDLADDFVRPDADALEYRCHHRPRRMRGGVPLRVNTLWASRANAERVVNAAPGLS
jgi:hypothetical protein